MSVSEAFNKMIDRPCMATSFAYSMIRVSTFSCERGAISTARTDKERATILSSSVHRTFSLQLNGRFYKFSDKPKQFCFLFRFPNKIFQISVDWYVWDSIVSFAITFTVPSNILQAIHKITIKQQINSLMFY